MGKEQRIEELAEKYRNFTLKQPWKLSGFERDIWDKSYDFARQVNALLEGRQDFEANQQASTPERALPNKPFPQRDDEGLLTVEEMGFIWGNCDPQTEISKRCLNIAKEQRDLDLRKRLDRPKVICLCGSTRFTDIMLVQQWELTKQGNIVLSWCALPDWYFAGAHKSHIGDQEGVKEIVDIVHLRKIDLADEVFVINKDSYIGESTANEIAYATKLGKPIKYLVAPPH